MNRVVLAIALVAALGFGTLGAEARAHEAPGMHGVDQHHGAMHGHMMGNPHHMLMMAYHDSLMSFGHKLMKVAKQGETVPRDFARTAVAEMRRSTEEMEKHRAEAMRNVPRDVKEHGDMQKMMDQHLVSVKTHLRELEDLTRSSTVSSQEVMKHLNAMLQECEGMDCGMMGGHRMHGEKGMHGMDGCVGCPCPQMKRHHDKMEGMVQKMKMQDAELNQQVKALRSADASGRLTLLSDIVETLVRQRAEMTREMESMMSKHGQHP